MANRSLRLRGSLQDGLAISMPYKTFVKVNETSLLESQVIWFGLLPVPWEDFPRRHDPEGKVENAENSGDRLPYSDSKIAEAEAIFKAFEKAWLERWYTSGLRIQQLCQKLKILQRRQRCLTSRGAEQERLGCISRESENRYWSSPQRSRNETYFASGRRSSSL